MILIKVARKPAELNSNIWGLYSSVLMILLIFQYVLFRFFKNEPEAVG